MNRKYHIVKIRKKNNGFRLLYIPNKELKLTQKKVLNNVLYMFAPSDHSYAYVKKRDIIQNAEKHLGAKVVIKLDITNFFNSIHIAWISNALERRIKDSTLIRDILDITTINNTLPVGAPTSPAISNIVLTYFDKIMKDYSNKYNLTYTRYADDITISSKVRLRKYTIRHIIRFVRIKLGAYKLTLNVDKIRILSEKNRMCITGIVINNKYTRVSRSYRNKVRAAIYQAETEEDIMRIKSRIAWIKRVNADSALKLEKMIYEKERSIRARTSS